MSVKRTPPKSDFEKLRLKHLQETIPFEDPDFPAQDSSVYFSKQPDSPLTWMRPHEILREKGTAREPKFLLDGGTRFDVKQNEFENCWVLAGAAAVCDLPEAFEWLVPHDQSFDADWYAGVFRFRFWQFGEWVEVYVDDRLPTADGDYIGAHSDRENVFWGCLLEKAYAKLYGSYEAIELGTNGESLADFTGGLVEYYSLGKVANLRRLLEKAFESASAVAAAIYREHDEKKGLTSGHAYSVTGFREAQMKGDGGNRSELLVRIRNPYGEETEWTGKWSDTCREWDALTNESKAELALVKKADGEFWMSLADFKSHFDSVTLCKFTPDSVEKDAMKNWKVTEIHGQWQKSASAGGGKRAPHGGLPRNEAAFTRFKQYLVKVEDYDSDDVASVVVQLMQKNVRHRRHLGKANAEVAFAVLRRPPGAALPLTYAFVNGNKAEVLAGMHHDGNREVTKRFNLAPGEYVILPTTSDPASEEEYLLRIFSEAPFETSEV